MSSLNETGLKYATDKTNSLHDFLHFYERRLSSLRNLKFTLIEVGVFKGGSVRTWGEYFPNATIVGLDVTESCREFESGNIKVRIGDASKVDFLFEVFAEFGKPAVFVDDGSHRWDHQISTFQTVFPILQPGGIYIMEDIDTSFQAHTDAAPFQGRSNISAVDYLAKLARAVIGEDAFKDENAYDLFIENWARWIGSIELGRRTSIISKKLSPGGGPR